MLLEIQKLLKTVFVEFALKFPFEYYTLLFDFQGMEAAIRIDVWKFLLGVYEWDSTYTSRSKARKRRL